MKKLKEKFKWAIVLSAVVAMTNMIISGFFNAIGEDLYRWVIEMRNRSVNTTTAESTTEVVDSVEEATTGTADNTIKYLNYIDSDKKNYPTTIDDFEEFNHPANDYKGVYPKDFFKVGYYDKEKNQYIFQTADYLVSLKYYQEEASSYGYWFKNDPLAIAGYLYEKDSKDMSSILMNGMEWVSPDLPYMSQLDENGCADYQLLGKNKKSGQMFFICRTCIGNTVYSLIVRYYSDNEITSNMNYLCESLYKGWSLGDSSTIRSYEEYCEEYGRD